MIAVPRTLSFLAILTAAAAAYACSDTERSFSGDDEANGDAGMLDDDGSDDDGSDDDGSDDDGSDDTMADDMGDGEMDGGASPAGDAGLMMSCMADEDCDDGNVCNGSEGCADNACVAGTQADEGTECELPDGEGKHFCVSGNCSPSRCGDGVVDADADEQCDDGNAEAEDGCESDCTFTCTENTECDDSNICNGDEVCNDERVCEAGTNLDNGASCGEDRNCNEGRCVPVGCGDGVQSQSEQCDDGNLEDGDGCDSDCTYTCEGNEQCNDLNPCNGVETCDLDTHACVAGTPMDCNDDNDCTADSCDPESGKCINELIDEDGDKHASEDLGNCGDDCDDGDKTIFTGAEELCDDKDNNCNGDIDETAPTHYVDCDGDGFAAADAVSIKQCDTPPPSTNFCNEGQASAWTTTAPGAGTTDCWDKSADVHPMTATESNSAWSADEIAGRAVDVDYDYNCDEDEEKRYTRTGVSKSASCGLVYEPIEPIERQDYQTAGAVIRYCPGAAGYTANTAPDCGDSGEWTYCKSDCNRATTSRTQQCR